MPAGNQFLNDTYPLPRLSCPWSHVRLPAMNHVERFRAVSNFQPVDRLPRWEWAMWWDQTIARWHGEGLPRNLKFNQVF